MSSATDGWPAAATIIQAIGTVVALAGVALTFMLTRRGQGQAAALARNDAERAERADDAAAAKAERAEHVAALSIDQMTRMAEAIEALVVTGAGTSAPGVQWSLEHHGGDTYILKNTGSAVAYRVEITGHESLMGPSHFTGGPAVGPKEAITFMAGVTMGTADATIQVSWRTEDNGDSEGYVWRYPLPGRPPR